MKEITEIKLTEISVTPEGHEMAHIILACKDLKLVVAETFYSIQGEGTTTGCPSVFLRLGGCNLLCESEHWRCDTIEVWRKGRVVDFEVVLYGFEEQLINGAHLVITGGEPLMQDKMLAKYLHWLTWYLGVKPYVEIETNGTILPYPELIGYVDKWNVSPKLSSSGMPYAKRVNELALRWFNGQLNADFKFVMSREEDLEELLMLDGWADHISMRKVLLMPAGETQEKLNKMRLYVVEWCKRYYFRYTDRQHIIIWNQKTGV